MRVGWTVIYVLASIYLVGMLMSITGQPFRKLGMGT